MQLSQRGKNVIAGLVAGVVIGGGLATVTPAGAAAINWKTVWKKEIKPRADKRYYTKTNANQTFTTQAGLSSTLGGYYTKAQSDAKYAPAQPLYRGSIMLQGTATAAGVSPGAATGISFGATFSAAPTPHYIKLGTAVPAGCLGTAAAPNAQPGHLCIFETEAVNVATNRGVCAPGSGSCGAVDPWGAGVFSYSAAAGQWEILASWAARPLAVTNPSRAGTSGQINGGTASDDLASAR